MAEKKDRETPGSAKPESASKGGKHAYEQRGRPGHVGQSHQDTARGERNPSNFPEGSQQAPEGGRKGRQR